MKQSIKRTCVGILALILALVVCATATTLAPTVASADPTLPFTLVAPQNVTMTKSEGDSPTTMGYAYGFSNEMVDYVRSLDGVECSINGHPVVDERAVVEEDDAAMVEEDASAELLSDD